MCPDDDPASSKSIPFQEIGFAPRLNEESALHMELSVLVYLQCTFKPYLNLSQPVRIKCKSVLNKVHQKSPGIPFHYVLEQVTSGTPYSHSTHRDLVDPQKVQSAELGSTACPNLLLCLVWQVGLHSESSEMLCSTACLKHFALFDVRQLGLFRLVLNS